MLRRLAMLIAIVAVAGFGCGGDDNNDVTGTETASVTVGMSATTNQQLSSANSSTHASIFSELKAIETASSTCDFTVSEGTLTGDGNIGLRSDATSLANAKAECPNISNCIWCYVSAVDVSGTCNITCQGAIAVNAYTPSDYFDTTFTATHAFTTEMEADGQGMIRIDGDPINFGDGTDDLTYVSQDFIQTDCSDASAVVVEDESNTTLTGLTVDGDAYDATSSDGTYHEYYEITTSAASEGNPKSCTVQDQVVVRCTVPSNINGATTMDCSTSGTWYNMASICEGQDICAEFVP